VNSNEDKWLAVVDTQRITEYVFEGNELALMRGASRLLANCTDGWSKMMAGDEEIFCGGGNALGLFETRARARAFCLRAVSALTDSTSSATAAWHVEGSHGRDFGEWRDGAFRGLQARRHGGGPPQCGASSPYSRFCDKCGVRNAERRSREGSAIAWVCESCRKKRRVSRAFWFGWFLPDTSTPAGDCPQPAADLSQIGQCSRPAGYVAFIHLDINQLGRLFQSTVQPNEFKKISSAVKESVHSGVVTGLKLSVMPQLLGDGLVLPFEIFLIGGDEALLVTPAHLALSFMDQFLVEFEQKFRSFSCDDPPGVSAGIVFAHSRFPVRAAADTARHLLSSCKAKGRLSDKEHMVDYMAISSALEQPVEPVRLTQFDAPHGKLISRPLQWSEMAGVRELCSVLRDLPRSKVHGLYDLMFRGRYQTVLDYCNWLRSLEESQRNRLYGYCETRGMFASPFDAEGNTPMIDAIELMDFLEERSADS